MPTPTIPFVLSGTATGANASFKVRVWNKTLNTYCTGTLNASGQYLSDLANCGYSVGDVVKVMVSSSLQAIMSTFTITQTMVDDGGYELDMTVRELPEHIFWSVYNIINDDLPSDFTDTEDSSTVSWTITSAFPEVNPTYPVIVVDSSMSKTNFLTMDDSEDEEPSEIDIMFYTKAKWHKKQIDVARGKVKRLLIEQVNELNFANLFFDKGIGAIDESNVDTAVFSEEKVNIATTTLNVKWSA